MQRIGRKHEPAFRMVVTESENSTKSGKSLEVVGNYDARRGEQATIKADRVTYWISKGAQPTPTVHNLLVTRKIIEGKKINNLPLKKAVVKEASAVEVAPAETVAEEAPAEAAPEAAPEVATEPAAEVVA